MLLMLCLTGGLVSYPARTPSPQLQQNGGFESGLEGWTAGGYTLDSTTFHSGKASLRLSEANQIRHAQSVSQLLPGKVGPGFYRVTAWLKMQGLGANGRNKGVRIGLRSKEVAGEARCSRGCSFTKVYSGTADWFRVDFESVYLSDPSLGVLVTSDAYGDPSGTLWLDDIVVQEEQHPALDVVLRVPNYRGILWSDQPQVAEFDVTQKIAGAITAIAVDDTGSSKVFAVQPGRTSLDLSGFSGSHLTVNWRVDGSCAYPDFRLVRRPASERSSLTITFSPDGRFLVRGEPRFLLGVYDSGLGYTTTKERWENSFTTNRRLFELQGINSYVNYFFGEAPTNSLLPMMDALRDHGILYWQTANCFGRNRYGNRKGFPGTGPDPLYATTLGQHPGLGGWYLADECEPGLADEILADHQLLQERDSDGVNMGVFNRRDVRPWLPSLDVVGVDEYPLFGVEPVGGYSFGKVYEGAAAVREAVGDNRPFWQVIQFFKFTSKGRWPTRDELRNMSYAAIVGGADGLFYWSLGTNALAHVCRGWCPEKLEYFERLKAVFAELSGLTALANEDLPASTVVVSDPSIKVRVKKGNGAIRFHILAYNHSPQSRKAMFEVPSVAGTSTSFGADFGPWGVNIFDVR